MSVLQFWIDEVKAYTNLQAKAVAAVASAEAELAGARSKQGLAVAAAVDAQKSIAALRTKIATDGPADAAADALTLRTLIAQSRDAAGQTLFHGGFLIKAQSALLRAHAELDRATQKLAAASAAKDQAAKQNATFAAWQNELAAPPLATVPSDAKDKLNGLNGSTERAVARKKLDDYFPPKPEDCIVQSALSKRRSDFNTIQAYLAEAANGTRTKLVDHLAASAGPDNAVRKAQITFDVAWNDLARHVRTAKDDLDRAVALYASVAAMPSMLSVLIQNDILKKSTYGKDASDALEGPNGEKARNQALTDASDALYQLDKARIAAESDPTSSTAAATLTDAITKAQNSTFTFVTVDKNFVANANGNGNKAALDAWIAVLPDDVIRAVLAVQEADEILTRLSSIDAGSLVKAVTTADDNLASALLDAARSDRTTAYLEDALAQRLTWLAKAEQGRLDNLFSAVRGDR